MKYFKYLAICVAFCSWTNEPCQAQGKTANRPPVIKHEAVTTAVKGQSISVRAVITDDTESIKSVSLFYTASKDAAPFKIEMQSAGAGSYFGSIPSSLLKGIKELSYYIEAIDDQDSATETPWYVVKIQTAQPVASQPIPPQPPVSAVSPVQVKASQPTPVSVKQAEAPKESWSWKGPAIIAGSAAAVVGGAMLASNSGSSSSDDNSSGGGTSVTNTGTYSGTATRYLQMAGGTPSTESYAIAITITSSGTATSDTLHPGASMQAPINGTSFQMTAAVSQSNLTGQIIYSGSILNSAITGPIAGAVTSSTGTNGTYSGNFSATKQ